jgi:hypothetical protein
VASGDLAARAALREPVGRVVGLRVERPARVRLAAAPLPVPQVAHLPRAQAASPVRVPRGAVRVRALVVQAEAPAVAPVQA